MSLIAGVLLLVVGAAIAMVGLFVSDTLNDTVNESLGAGGDSGATLYTTANATEAMDAAWGTFNNAMSAFTLIGIAFIAIGAAIILSILRSAF